MQGLFDQNILASLASLADITLNTKKIAVGDAIDDDNTVETVDETNLDKILKSDKLNIHDRIALIRRNVLRVLGKFKNSVICIRSKEELLNYVNAAIKVKRLAIDTETNNSLDPVTCKLAGLCLYYPGGKQAYIPINHRDPDTKIRLDWQCTEEDVKEALELVNANEDVAQILHNAKFDYEVILCTCGVKIKPSWDTMTFMRLWDENDLAGLKYLFRKFVNPGQAKYDIEKLFTNISYLDLPPELFALYAATDSYETDEVFIKEVLWMFDMLEEELRTGGFVDEAKIKPEFKDLYGLFKNVEMPITTITGDMELTGVAVDQKLGERLKVKYTRELEQLDTKIESKMSALTDKILDWRLSKEANDYPKQYEPKKSKKTRTEIMESYPLVDEKSGKRYRIAKKCLKDQITDPINLASSTQMAILFYDILSVEPFDRMKPRGTSEEHIEIIKEKLEAKAAEVGAWLNPDIEPTYEDKQYLEKLSAPYKAAAELCKLLLKRRGIVKLITTYIDTIPTLVNHWPDGRIRFHMNPLGTDTGRFSSGGKLKFMENDQPIEVSGINIQNIPSGCPSIRMMFTAQTTYDEYEADEDNSFIIHEYEEVETNNGWKYPRDLARGDELITDEGNKPIIGRMFDPNAKMYRILV